MFIKIVIIIIKIIILIIIMINDNKIIIIIMIIIIFFFLQTHSKILSRRQMFLHLYPLTIHLFSSHLKKEIMLLGEEDYESLMSL